MPSLNYDFLKLLQDDYKNYPYFIETGTYLGETIFTLEPYFSNLYTIELSELYYTNTKKQYNGHKINFLLGDSSTVFQTLLPTIPDKAIFFLDGHWSGGNTGQGDKDCPLIEEITHIYHLFKHDAIIIIDDVRLFGIDARAKGDQDWSEIHTETLLNILSNRISKMYYLDSVCAKNDRLIIHIHRSTF